MSTIRRIALLGFGEVGQILAADLHARSLKDLSAWDLLFAAQGSAPQQALAAGYVRAGAGAAEAVAGAQLVISAVTAAQAVEAARAAAEYLAAGAFYLDLNSISPGAKRGAAALVEARGGRFVEAAVMSPVPPRRIASPMLLGGPHAAAFLPLARELGFGGAQAFSGELGRASAAKMCRSVVIKGLEALLAESLLSARRHGVEAAVLDSLRDLFPGADWPTLAQYMISRSLLHGRRRAEEMSEVARTVAEAGLEPWMSDACAQRQDWAAGHRSAAARGELAAMLDAILASSHAPGDATA